MVWQGVVEFCAFSGRSAEFRNIHVYVYTHFYRNIYTCICMLYICCMYIEIYMYVQVYMYVYIYIYIQDSLMIFLK